MWPSGRVPLSSIPDTKKKEQKAIIAQLLVEVAELIKELRSDRSQDDIQVEVAGARPSDLGGTDGWCLEA